MTTTRQLSVSCLTVAGFSCAAPVLAQTPENVGEIGEIIVTATRRSESLQDVPLSLAAFSADFIEKSNIADVNDLSLFTPGLLVTDQNSTFGSANLFIRGVGTAVRGIGADQAVAIYEDGVFRPNATTILQDFLDIERLEVLRGPQGTLYGRNATGGALNIVSKRPSEEFEAKADASFGSFNAWRVRGSLNGPLVGDTLAGRLAVVREQGDLYTENLRRSQQGLEDDSDADITAVKGALGVRWDSGDLVLRGAWFEDDSFGRIAVRTDPAGSVFPLFNSLFGMPLPTPQPTDKHELFSDVVAPEGTLDQRSANAELRWGAGAVKFTSITAFQTWDTTRLIDGDGTDSPLSVNDLISGADTWTQEFQLSSDTDGPFEWIAGLYYFTQDSDQGLTGITRAGLPSQVVNRPVATLETEAYAAFGEGTLELSDHWALTIGARYSDETKDHVLRVNGVVQPGSTGRVDFDNWSPRVVLEWQPSESLLAYASVSDGFKSGGFNSTQNQAPYPSEEIRSYEIGVKSAWLEGRLIANTSVFHYDYENLQTQVGAATIGGVLLVLTPDAEAFGGEVEVVYRPSPQAFLSFGASLLDAQFDGTFIGTNPATNRPEDVDGNDLTRAPGAVFNLVGEYQFALAQALNLAPRIEIQQVGEHELDIFNNAGAHEDAYTLLGASVTLSSRDDRWLVQLYGKNLLDEEYRQNVNEVPLSVGRVEVWARPRTYGVRAGVNFD